MIEVVSLREVRPETTTAALLDDPGLSVVAAGMSKDPNGKVTLLFIAAGEAAPRFALKLPLTSIAAQAVEQEELALRALAACDLAGLAGTVPRVLGWRTHRGRSGLLTTALPGRSMLSLYHSWRRLADLALTASDFRAAGEWLALFQAQTAGERGPSTMAARAYGAISGRFAEHHDLERALALVARLNQRLTQLDLPRTAVHGDYWSGNLLRAGDSVTGVVDWESGAVGGDPLRDLARFAIAHALYLDRHALWGRVAGHPHLRAYRGWGAGVEYAICGRGAYPDLVATFVGDGLQRLGGDRRLWRDVLMAGLAEVAATADDPGFAERTLGLLLRVAAHDRVVWEV